MGSISINDVMAVRGAILGRNAALRNVAGSVATATASSTAGGATFAAAMDTALRKPDNPTVITGASVVGGTSETGGAQQGGFASTMQAQLQRVNEINARAGDLTVAYERGEETDIAKVMLARQASSIAFEATLQVRNKLLSAYKDVMSMSI